MQHPGTDTGSSDPHWGEKEHIASVHVPLMTGTEASHGPHWTDMSRLIAMVTCDQLRLARCHIPILGPTRKADPNRV